MKAKVPLRGRLGGVLIDTKATRGATVGVDLFWADGSLVQVTDFAADVETAEASEPNGAVSRTLWSLVAEVPVNVQAVAALATDGFVRKSENTWSASDPQAAEITYDNTASGLAAEDVQAAIDEVASGVGVPTVMSAGQTFTVPANRQVLFAIPIDVGLGTLDVSGDLVEVY